MLGGLVLVFDGRVVVLCGRDLMIDGLVSILIGESIGTLCSARGDATLSSGQVYLSSPIWWVWALFRPKVEDSVSQTQHVNLQEDGQPK